MPSRHRCQQCWRQISNRLHEPSVCQVDITWTCTTVLLAVSAGMSDSWLMTSRAATCLIRATLYHNELCSRPCRAVCRMHDGCKNVHYNNKIAIKRVFYEKNKTLKTLNKNVGCKISRTNWKSINKTISYMALWSTFDWNFNTLI